MPLKNTLKILFDTCLIFFAGILMYYNQLVIYGLKMGKGQLHIVWNARPMEECLKDPALNDTLKSKLLLIQEIRKYAIDSLGLKNSVNYTTFYDQGQQPAIWVISACEPFELKVKAWKFPIIGSVPYKGFFNKEEARDEQYRLREDGYDTRLGTTSGWSTLGWFKDPILSNMIYQSEGNLAELIIHELTHSTIFIKDQIQHNENLANFVGETGAKKFLLSKYGLSSKEYVSYLHQQEDELLYNRYMLKSLSELDSLYKSFSPGQSPAEKIALKEKVLIRVVWGVSNLKLNDYARYLKISRNVIISKNAFFMEFMRYDSEHDYFEREMNEKAGGDLRKFIHVSEKAIW